MNLNMWLRWYVGTCEDRKLRVVAVQSKTSLPVVIAIWVMLLEDAAHREHRGDITIGADEIDAFYDLQEGNTAMVLQVMTDLALLTITKTAFRVTAWNKRQYINETKDPTATERKQKSRSRQGHGLSRQGHGLSRPDSDSDSDSEVIDTSDFHTIARDVWNGVCVDAGLSKIQSLTTRRKKAIGARIKDAGGAEQFHNYLRKIAGNEFLTGDNNNKWRASFDWALKPASYAKVMEGTYDRSGNVRATVSDFDAALGGGSGGMEISSTTARDSDAAGAGITIEGSAGPVETSDEPRSCQSALDPPETVFTTERLRRDDGRDLPDYA